MRARVVQVVAGLCLAALLAGGVGCASVTGAGTARTLPPGEHEIGSGLEFGLGLPKIAPTYHAPLPWPQLVLGYRRGLTERLDVGARAWGFGIRGLYTVGAEVDTKIALKRAEATTRGIDYTLDPAVSYHQVAVGRAPTHSLIVQSPLLIGFNANGGDQFVVGPRLGYQGVFGPDLHPVHLFSLGTNLGYHWQVTDKLAFFPEVVFAHAPVSFNGVINDAQRRGLTIFQIGLGLRFDI